MENLTYLQSFRKKSLKAKLRDLYFEIDKTSFHKECSAKERQAFFSLSFGKFFKIYRESSMLNASTIATKANISTNFLFKAEEGTLPLGDELLFLLCDILGANNEVGVLLEKIEEALKSDLKKSRHELAEVLLSYGIKFSDPDKYKDQTKGVVLNFPNSN